jgi:putative Ca2+/H+ antiporter (TMEM165/GDT1 family)
VIQDFLIPFISIGLAELGDRTQLAVLCLASKTQKYLQLLLGVILAFAITDGLAIILGNFITAHIPTFYIKIVSGAIFIIFGIIMLINNKSEEAHCELKQPFASGFLLILVSEMGDKTQIAAGLFATKYNAFIVFIAVLSSLTVLSVMAVYLGKYIALKINKKVISLVAGIMFIVLGILFFFKVK